jgi:hypothetical protein
MATKAFGSRPITIARSGRCKSRAGSPGSRRDKYAPVGIGVCMLDDNVEPEAAPSCHPHFVQK